MRSHAPGSRLDRFIHAAFSAAALLAASCAHSTSPSSLTQEAHRYIERLMAPYPGDLEVRIHHSAPQPAPCEEPQFFLPWHTNRPIGKISIGVRCAGEPQPRYILATVDLRVRYWATKRALERGSSIAREHLSQREGRMTQLPKDIVLELEQAEGLTARRSLPEGAALRFSHLEQRLPVQRRDPVSVEVQGNGFRIVGEGQALESGHQGEAVRIRLPNRDVIEAIVVGPRTVRPILGLSR